MGNLADESGTDIEIYRRALNPDTIHIVSRSNAPEELLVLLDSAGLERKTDGPAYVWHETPEGLSEQAQKQLATRAVLPLLLADYVVNIDPDVYDVTAWAQEMAKHRTRQAKAQAGLATAVPPQGAPGSPPRSR
ncbi:hypothetical protein [Streptomyces sp. H27-S2]|uniref:hypothetical protein n=1 Tax=Streptomyces antarcticus TaxID=2996458 RepID=UPI00226F123D|nr:hypothetical protein [Streptomyces sp. H27-S2]MCY0954964.1 hypothetical protein [Streptomyces sp. H27-S2]